MSQQYIHNRIRIHIRIHTHIHTPGDSARLFREMEREVQAVQVLKRLQPMLRTRPNRMALLDLNIVTLLDSFRIACSVTCAALSAAQHSAAQHNIAHRIAQHR